MPPTLDSDDGGGVHDEADIKGCKAHVLSTVRLHGIGDVEPSSELIPILIREHSQTG